MNGLARILRNLDPAFTHTQVAEMANAVAAVQLQLAANANQWNWNVAVAAPPVQTPLMDPPGPIPAVDLNLMDDLNLDVSIVQKMATSDVQTYIEQNSSACPYFHFGRFLGECRDAQFWAMGLDGQRTHRGYYRSISNTFLTTGELYMLHKLRYLFLSL